jgi:hypothetical protein
MRTALSTFWVDDRGLSILLASLVVIIVVPALVPVGLLGRLSVSQGAGSICFARVRPCLLGATRLTSSSLARRVFSTFAHGRCLVPIVSLSSVTRLVLVAVCLLVFAGPATAAPEGQLTYAVHITLVTRWLDPVDLEGLITPFIVFYALHDAVVKSMPGERHAPSLAESWTVSKDGTVIDFALRKGVTFHNGDPFTAEDVRFSFQRYKGVSAKLLKERARDRDRQSPIACASTSPAPGRTSSPSTGRRPRARAGSFPSAISRGRRRRLPKAPVGPPTSSSRSSGDRAGAGRPEHYWRKV